MIRGRGVSRALRGASMPKGRGSSHRSGGGRRVPRAGAGPPADRVKLVTEAMGDLGPCEVCGSWDLATLWDRRELVPVVTYCWWCGEVRHDWSGSGVRGGV